jgi:hypothetical protein
MNVALYFNDRCFAALDISAQSQSEFLISILRPWPWLLLMEWSFGSTSAPARSPWGRRDIAKNKNTRVLGPEPVTISFPY